MMSQDNINININETNPIVNIVSSEIVETIDINVGETIEEVVLNITEEVIQVNVNKIQGGGGNQNLQQVTDEGNTTTNDIQLINTAELIFGAGGGILLDNASRLREGTIDAGLGGSKGIAQICGVGYELKWEAGRLYVMNGNGDGIRWSLYNFTNTPTINDDNTKGYTIGSYWSLDNGNVYECTDATTGAAVWELVNLGTTPNLQQVTDVNATTTNTITIGDITTNYSQILDTAIGTENDVTGTYAYLDNTGQLGLHNGDVESDLRNTNVTNSGVVLEFPNKTTGIYTIATTSDIPSVSGFVPYTNATQNVDLGEYQIKVGQIELDQSPTGTAGVAITRWNDSIGSTETTLKGGNVVLKNGVDLVARVVNKVTPNTTLTKAAYQAVRVSSAQGQRLAVSLAQANNDNNSADTIGLVCETIPTNQEGFIITVGQLEGINTTGSLQGETWTDGDVLYLSPTTAGRLTNIKPTGVTGHIVVIGYVEYSHQNNGKIYVKVMNGWELDELHNVNISTPLNNQVLAYTSSNQNWENKSLKSIEGLNLLGSGDLEYYNNLFFEQNLGYMIPNSGATTYNSLRNTTSIIQTGQTSDFNIPTRILYASTTTIGAFALQRGTIGGSFVFSSANKNYFKRRFQIDSNISGSRFVCGLSNQFGVAAPTNVEPDTLINTIGVCKLSTSNNLHIFYNDATGLATTVDLGVNYPANNVTAYIYDLEIYKENATANLTIKVTRIDASGNRISTSQTINSNYNTSNNIYPIIYGTNNATAAAFRFFDFGIIFKNYNLQWDTI